jgi:hypothetical protein
MSNGRHILFHSVEVIEGLSKEIEVALDVPHKITFYYFEISAHRLIKTLNLSRRPLGPYIEERLI